MPYVVVEPEESRGIYVTWEECQTALKGASGVRRLMKVKDTDQGEAILSGKGVVLAPGLYLATDGNHYGGVGVVIAQMGNDDEEEPRVLSEIATCVGWIFEGAEIEGLDSAADIDSELGRIRNILAEMAGLYEALRQMRLGTEATIIHDYEGVGAFMQGEWRPKDSSVRSIVEAARKLRDEKALRLMFIHVVGHTATKVGRHDLARLNGRADNLAAHAARNYSRNEQ